MKLLRKPGQIPKPQLFIIGKKKKEKAETVPLWRLRFHIRRKKPEPVKPIKIGKSDLQVGDAVKIRLTDESGNQLENIYVRVDKIGASQLVGTVKDVVWFPHRHGVRENSRVTFGVKDILMLRKASEGAHMGGSFIYLADELKGDSEYKRPLATLPAPMLEIQPEAIQELAKYIKPLEQKVEPVAPFEYDAEIAEREKRLAANARRREQRAAAKNKKKSKAKKNERKSSSSTRKKS